MAGFFKSLNKNADNDINNDFQQLDMTMSQVANRLDFVSDKIKNFSDIDKISPFVNEFDRLLNLIEAMKNTDLNNINQDINSMVQSVSQLNVILSGLSNVQGINDIKNNISETNKILQELSNTRLNNISDFLQLQSVIDQITKSFSSLNDQAVQVNQVVSNMKLDNLDISDDLKNNISAIDNFAKDIESKINEINKNKDQLLSLDPQKNKEQYESLFSDLINLTDNFTKEFSDKFNLSKAIQEVVSNSQGDIKNLESNIDSMVSSMGKMMEALPLGNLNDQLKDLAGSFIHLKSTIDDSSDSSHINKFGDSIDKVSSQVLDLAKEFERFNNVASSDEANKGLEITENQIKNTAFYMDMFSGKFDILSEGIGKSRSEIAELYGAMGDLNNITNSDLKIGTDFPELIAHVEKAKSEIDKLKNDIDNVITGESGFNQQSFRNLISSTPSQDNEYYKLLEIGLADKSRGSYERYVNNIGGQANNIGDHINRINNQLNSQHSNMSLEQKAHTKLTLGNTSEISDAAREIEKLTQIFESTKAQLLENIKKYTLTGDEDVVKQAEEELESLTMFSESLSQKIIGLSSLIKLYNSKEFDKLPEETKQLVEYINGIVQSTQQSNNEVIRLSEAFGKSSDNVKSMNDKLSETESKLNLVTGKAESFGSKFKNVLSDILSPLGSVTAIASAIGIGGLGINRYISSTSDYYKMQGMMDVDSAYADLGLGAQYDAGRALDRSYNQALRYHNMSNGLIGFEEFNRGYTNLARNVGGQQGISGDQAAADLSSINEDTFALSRVYGISDNTIAQATKVFYQDYKMNVKDTVDTIRELAQVARSANIPIDKYIQQVSSLAEGYKRVGLNGKDANNIMGNLLHQGMTQDAAFAMASTIPSSISSMANNISINSYAGMLSGQFSNPWAGIRAGLDITDKHGNYRDGYGQMMANNVDAWMRLNAGIAGANPDMQYIQLHQTLMKDLGMDSRSASTAASLYMEDKNTFAKFMDDNIDSIGKQKVVVEGQDELQDKIKLIASTMAETQKIESEIANSQYQSAIHLERMAINILPSIKGTIENLNKTVQGLFGTASNTISNIAGSSVGQAYGEALSNNPIIVGGASLLGVYGIKTAASVGTKQLLNKFFSGGSKAIANSGDELASIASAGASSGGLSKALTASKKALPWVALAAGTAYAGKKVYDYFNKDDDEELGYYDVSSYGGNYSNGDRLYSRVTDIYNVMVSNGIKSQYSVPSGAPEGTNVYDSIKYSMVTPGMLEEGLRVNLGEDVDFNSSQIDQNSDLGVLLGTMGATAIGAGLSSKLIYNKALNAGLKSGKSLAVATRGASSLASAGSAVIGDAIYHTGDFIGHHIKGDAVSEDFGKSAAGFLTDASWTATGAAIGSMIPVPVLGTLVGALGGYVTQQIVEGVTRDESGKGLVSKTQDGLTSLFTGKTVDEIEYKRNLINNPNELAVQRYQMLGLGRNEAEKMVEALEKHADSLKDLTSEQKDAWAFLYTEMKNSGTKQEEIISSLTKAFGDDKIKQDITDAILGSINDIALSQGIDISKINKFNKNAELNVDEIIDFKGKYDDIFEDILLSNIGSELYIQGLPNKRLKDKARNNPREILDIYNDNQHSDYNTVSKWINSFYGISEKSAEKQVESLIDDTLRNKKEEKKLKEKELQQMMDEGYGIFDNFLGSKDVQRTLVDKELASLNSSLKNAIAGSPNEILLQSRKEELEGIKMYLDDDYEAQSRESLSKMWDKRLIKPFGHTKDSWIDYQWESGNINNIQNLTRFQDSWSSSMYSDLSSGSLDTYNDLLKTFGNNKDLKKFGSFLLEADSQGKYNINELDKNKLSQEHKNLLEKHEDQLIDIAMISKETKDSIDKQTMAMITAFTNNDSLSAITGTSSTSNISNLNLGGILANHGKDFIEVGNKYGVDPLLMAAIAMHETANGTSNALRTKNNVGGFMGSNGLRSYDSIEDSIDFMGKLLKNHYIDLGYDTIEKIQTKYAPVGAKNDPTGLNKNWVSGVTNIYNSLSKSSLGTTGYLSGNIMEDVARQQVGKNYVLGTEGPIDWDGDGEATDAYDCSGLVSYAAHIAGIGVGRLTANELYKKCQEISESDLQPGDLGFSFNEKNIASHVGIFTSKRTWIHAANSNRGVVEDKFYSWSKYGRLPGADSLASSDINLPNVASSTSPSSALSSGTSDYEAGEAGDLAFGRMLYGIMPSDYSSYFNNDPSSKSNYVKITQDILRQGGSPGLGIGDQQSLARKMRVDLDNLYLKPGMDDPFAEIISNFSSTGKIGGASNSKIDVNFVIEGSKDNETIKSMINDINMVLSNYGATISDIKERVDTTEETVVSLGDNLMNTNGFVNQLR